MISNLLISLVSALVSTIILFFSYRFINLVNHYFKIKALFIILGAVIGVLTFFVLGLIKLMLA